MSLKDKARPVIFNAENNAKNLNAQEQPVNFSTRKSKAKFLTIKVQSIITKPNYCQTFVMGIEWDRLGIKSAIDFFSIQIRYSGSLVEEIRHFQKSQGN